jgi:hypothetical protein
VAEEEEAFGSKESTPAFGTPPRDWRTYSTPRTVIDRQIGADYLIIRLRNGEPLTPTIIRVLEKTEKATQRMVLEGQLTKELLMATTAAEKERQRRKNASGIVVQKYGEIYTHKARQQIAEDEEDE